MPVLTDWKTDNYKFVGKAFEIAYKNMLNELALIMGEANTNSIDYEIEGAGGYGELEQYYGELNYGQMKRAFKTIVTPQEFQKSIPIHFKQARVDKSGECRKVGSRLGNSAAMTVYLHALRAFAGAFNGQLGGDGKTWAASDHPVASKGSEGRKFIADPEAGTYSNKITKKLSVAAVTEAKSMARRFVCPDGAPFACRMDTLLVSPELEPVAQQICGANSKLWPGKAEDVNPVHNTLSYIVIGGGTDGFSKDQWAICDKAIMKEVFKCVYITKPRVIQSGLDNPLIDLHTAYTDFGIGWGDARQIIFSTGTTT